MKEELSPLRQQFIRPFIVSIYPFQDPNSPFPVARMTKVDKTSRKPHNFKPYNEIVITVMNLVKSDMIMPYNFTV